ncbi:SMP-30/gluconolactonase/LRE family protein [Sphingomonas sp. AP4-R1]|uniref:SMP-30/gluconolactonase/LRE family protein n=1 Tax=Sphingomonas sp. AP4-R1 TaxID=2735134 RepID=UPI001493926B|nr:SMP-30/gluconolactonase/LRE family protein [Sphingomonas sp. AP4-R1]QJU58322.1 SMP-30/gluconolactonase/LRE family protein [Sphingomonas sp. AP4-R1]
MKIVERAVRDTLGEGPVWDPARGELVWVDILAPCVHRLSLEDGRVDTMPVDEPVGWVLPRAGATDFVAGFRSGFHFLDLETGARRAIGTPESDRPQNRLNDAKVDPMGRIWAGSKDDSDQLASGALYRLDPSLSWSRQDDGYGIANGPTFSPDGRTLYHTDSAARQIYAFDMARDGSLSGKRLWLTFEEEWGYPDGMTTDAEGCIWIAHWDGGRISRFSPDGVWRTSIALPASNITSCAFAGDRLDRLFVTSSTIGREDERHAGALFELAPGVAGLPPTLFLG